jgi:hypothetical protein
MVPLAWRPELCHTTMTRSHGHLSTRELQELAREILGHDVSAEQAEAYRTRLPTMARVVRTLRKWEPELRGVEPAAVYSVSVNGNDNVGD